MLTLFLIFLSIWPANTADPKCPEHFVLVTREPNAMNSYTKHWCLTVVSAQQDIRNRDFARSLCISKNSTLSIPANEEEAEALAGLINKNTSYEMGFAMDGEITAKCRSQFFRTERQFPKEKGECAVQGDLFAFDDNHTDPTFIKKEFDFVPSQYASHSVEKSPTVQELTACAVLTWKHNDNITRQYANLAFCYKTEGTERIYSAVCGRLPL